MATEAAAPAAVKEDPQLLQTIEMFEVITQSQPHDCQSLEILKEAYSKLGRHKDYIDAAKRIAQAYVAMGQLSSAILEYESILQRFPDDPDVQKALNEIEGQANNLTAAPTSFDTDFHRKGNSGPKSAPGKIITDFDDGKGSMHKLFVASKEITQPDFDLCWGKPDPNDDPLEVVQPYLQVLADRALMALEKSMKLLTSSTGLCYMPLEKYDFDIELSRTFPKGTCRRWCVLPIDRMSKSIMVATCNPFNKQAALELEAATNHRILWYLSPPHEIAKAIKKAFR